MSVKLPTYSIPSAQLTAPRSQNALRTHTKNNQAMQLEYLSVKLNTLKRTKSIFNVIVNFSLFILGSSLL